MKKVTWAEQLRYRFDNFMSRGTIALIAGLALVSLGFILLMGIFVTLTGIAPEGSDRLNPLEATWSVLMRTLDAGTMGGDTGWLFRLAMLLVTFGGIFIISTLIGVLSTGIDIKLEDLRKGRSRVIETNHIVILGWSLQIFTLISELALANANQPDTCIVILSEEDKVQMEDALQDTLGKLKRIRLVCRTGNPSSMADLGMVSIQSARSIIIPKFSQGNGDTQLIKTLLAITNIPRAVPHPYHIVAQVQDHHSLDILKVIAPDTVEVLLTNDLISKIVVQTCRQSGLSIVYLDLLDFSGNEIYFKAEPTLQGRTYGECLLSYNESAVIGIKSLNGQIHLNPLMERTLQAGEQLIFISEDDDTIHFSGSSNFPIDFQAIQLNPLEPAKAENTLILGWNERVPFIIQQLDRYVASGSRVTVVANFPEAEVSLSSESLRLQQQTFSYTQGDSTNAQVLENLNLTQYEQVIVVCNTNLDPEEADSQTLVTLLYLRNIADRIHHDFQIVTEILDARNQALAQVARPDDFIISEQILSRMLSQVAEQKSLNDVFNQLFSSEGAEIYLKPVGYYVKCDRPISFYTLVEAAKQRGESAIGYRIQADATNMAKSYGVVLNPKKDSRISFTPEDTLILVADS